MLTNLEYILVFFIFFEFSSIVTRVICDIYHQRFGDINMNELIKSLFNQTNMNIFNVHDLSPNDEGGRAIFSWKQGTLKYICGYIARHLKPLSLYCIVTFRDGFRAPVNLNCSLFRDQLSADKNCVLPFPHPSSLILWYKSHPFSYCNSPTHTLVWTGGVERRFGVKSPHIIVYFYFNRFVLHKHAFLIRLSHLGRSRHDGSRSLEAHNQDYHSRIYQPSGSLQLEKDSAIITTDSATTIVTQTDSPPIETHPSATTMTSTETDSTTIIVTQTILP